MYQLIPKQIKKAWVEYKCFSRVRDWVEGEEEIDRRLVLSLSPTVFKPKWGGRYLFADGCYMQILSVGDPSPINPNRQGIPPRKDLRLIDDLLDIPTGENACIGITQTAIPLPAKDETEALEAARRENILAAAMQEAENEGVFKNVHDKIIDYLAEGISEYNRAVFEGRMRMFEFSLLIAVKGKTTKDVDDLMSLIITLLDGKRVIHEIIEYGMVDAYYMMMPTPFIKERLLSTTNGEMVARTSPLRNKNPRLARSGRWLGINEDTNNPLFLNFHDGSLISGHAIVVGKSGSGKSTNLLTDDKRAIEDGDEAFHIVPKADEDTNHIRVCKELSGQLIKIGHKLADAQDADSNPNIFQVAFDPERMDNSISAYQLAYSKHISLLPDVIGLLIGSGFTDPQKNWIYNSLVEIYYKFKIIDEFGNVINTDKWEDGLIWPNFENWRALIYDWMQDEEHKAPQVNSVIAAIYNNTSMITRKGPYGFLVNNNSLKLRNKFTMADITELIDSPNIQDAIILYLTGVINTKIQCAPKDHVKKHIFITIDEGANLVKIPRMRKIIERMFRELRSFGGHLKIVFQDLAGVPNSMINMMKTNTDYVLLLSNMSAYNIKPLVKEFNLTKNDIRRLRAKGHGKGLLIVGDTHINYFNALTQDDERVIFGKEIKDKEDAEIKTSGPAGYFVNPRVEWVKRDHKIFVKDWLTGINLNQVIRVPGYEMEQFDHPFQAGKKTVYIEVGLEKEDGKIRNQSKEHYLFACALAGEGSLMGADASTDDYGTGQEVDVKLVFNQGTDNEIVIGIEVEIEKSHTVKQLQEKRDRLLMKKQDGKPEFDYMIFTGSHDYYKSTLREAVGPDYSRPRGKRLKDFILELVKAGKKATDNENLEGGENQDSENTPVFNLNFNQPVAQEA
jgi:hypothetical protein